MVTLILYERERRELGSFYRQPRGASSSLLSHRQPRPAQVPGGAPPAAPGLGGTGGGQRPGSPWPPLPRGEAAGAGPA